jgi:hypothetical protein
MPKKENTNKLTTPNFDTVDGRYLTRTNRTVHFATKVTPEFNQAIRRLAHEKRKLITEMLEEFLNAYFKLEKLELEKKEKVKVKNIKTKVKAKK